jgi:hypothetical protein
MLGTIPLRPLLGIMLMFVMDLGAAEGEKKKADATTDKGSPAVLPLFRNSIVSTDLDFIVSDDPSAFKALRFLGRKTREMPDRRSDELMDKETFVFEATFNDGSQVEIWAHSSFKSAEKAEHYALMLSAPLGKLPPVMRGKLSHVVIHQGDATAFGEAEGHFFVIYSENMETRVRDHDLEETVFHESVHATLEATYQKNREWLAAQAADTGFITRYAAENPSLEDLPETALFAYTMLKNPGRLSEDVASWVRRHMPNRLAFFQRVFSEE